MKENMMTTDATPMNNHTHPLLSISNILNATEKLDSGMLSRVTKKMYLQQQNRRQFLTHEIWKGEEEYSRYK